MNESLQTIRLARGEAVRVVLEDERGTWECEAVVTELDVTPEEEMVQYESSAGRGEVRGRRCLRVSVYLDSTGLVKVPECAKWVPVRIHRE